MDFDQIVVKESPGLCRCCLSEGCYKDLGTEYPWMEDTEIYADMLLECFDISISQHNEGPNGPKRLICEVCITRLRDACNFKKQVLDSEKKFVDMVGRGDFRPKAAPILYEEQMKSEISMEAVDMDDVEYLNEDDHFDDDSFKDEATSTRTDVLDTTVKKRGRPKKAAVKPEKKTKVAKVEEKPRTSKVSKGKKLGIAPSEARNKSLSSTVCNRLTKRNATIILECSTVVPFKWHRHNYLCFFCHKPFKSMDDLKGHTYENHENPCVKSAVSYLKRDEKVKIDVSSIACKICDERAADVEELMEHLKTVHGKMFMPFSEGVIPYCFEKDKFQCAVCGMEFYYFIKLNQHMNEHYGNYVCELCGKSFLSNERLRSHAANHGSGYKCNICPEFFDSLTQKNSHEAQVHNINKGIKCTFCSETFKNYALRKRHHVAVHDVQRPAINCPVCGKAFEIFSKMRSHLKEVHVREKNHSCSMCEQKFFSRTHLHRHMVKHYGERRYQCDVCKKSYLRKRTLRDHMRIHSNDRKYACSVCDHAFVQNNSLRMHMRVHHPDDLNSQLV